MEDEKIVDLFWLRSERAIEAAAAKYGAYCYAIAEHILARPEDAEEAVNDAYLGAWNSMPPHRPAVLRTFLGKLTRRISLKKYRDQHREKRGGGEVALALEELAECVPSSAAVEEELLARELAGALACFVAELPETERRVFLCRYWYLDSIGAISRSFRFSQSKVKSMLHRTRGKLLLYLNQEGAI